MDCKAPAACALLEDGVLLRAALGLLRPVRRGGLRLILRRQVILVRAAQLLAVLRGHLRAAAAAARRPLCGCVGRGTARSWNPQYAPHCPALPRRQPGTSIRVLRSAPSAPGALGAWHVPAAVAALTGARPRQEQAHAQGPHLRGHAQPEARAGR